MVELGFDAVEVVPKQVTAHFALEGVVGVEQEEPIGVKTSRLESDHA